jgi:hypothetical protein
MRRRSILRFAVVSGALVLGACAPSDQEAETTAEAEPEVEVEADAGTSMPEPSAEAVWQHLQASDYTSWALWPGKGEQYQGGEPHGMLLTTYVNALALDALTNGAGRMPAGAIIVKENFMGDGTHAATTVMYKSAGFDPEHNDWWWLKRDADGTIAAEGGPEGMAQMCIGCHSGKSDNDYIFTSELGTAGGM